MSCKEMAKAINTQMSRGFYSAVVIAYLALAPAAPALDAGTGCYPYKDAVTDKTLNVWYCKPEDFTPQTPVLIVMHGMRRTAEAYRNSWVEHVTREKIMLLTPEFFKRGFPQRQGLQPGRLQIVRRHHQRQRKMELPDCRTDV